MPVRDILLDASGNRVIVGSDYAVADGLAAVAQGVRCRVGLMLGEAWTDEGQGVDYLGKILIPNAQPLVVEAEVARAIAATPDVTRVVATSYAPPGRDRRAAVSYEAASPFGLVAGSASA